MDDFEELRKALEAIAEFQRGPGSIGSNCGSVLSTIQAEIKKYIKRKGGVVA
jgi:hypothetical protein